MTAKERLIEVAPRFTEVQAEAALRVLEAQIELSDNLDAEQRMSRQELSAREDRLAKANARDAIREERW